MCPSSRSRKRQRGGTIILLLAMIPLLLVPLIGLAVDGTRLYIVQSKLSAAVDGAALGAGRLLGTNANTTEIAGEFLNVNFPAHYWNTSNLQPNIQYTNNLGVQTISVYATVSLPLTFARMLGQTASLVSASSVATRRVTRIEIVLDRSGSMNTNDPVTGQNVFTTMKAGATWFAAQFTPGYDELGLVAFSGSAVVAYPTTHPWINNPTGAGGPDKTFATDPASQTGVVFTQLNSMAVGGGTGTSEAMAQAYVEIQKAHNRDLAANGVDNTLNTIVLFTDGVPDAIPAYINDPAHNSLKPPGALSTQSNCTNNPASGVASTQMRGYLVAGGKPLGPAGGGWTPEWGLVRLAAFDATNSLTWWLQSTGASDLTKGDPQTSLAGCTYLKSTGSTNDLKDLARIPDFDIYGYSTGGMGFTNSVLFDGTNTWQPNTTSYDKMAPTNPYMLAAASWNLTDTIGKAIRTQTAMNQIQIFTIGYSGNGGTDIGLLNRLANTPQSTSFVATEPIGKFYLVNSTSQLISAFNSVASSLLRLAY
jgi:Flp pilus assembly protein TadG